MNIRKKLLLLRMRLKLLLRRRKGCNGCCLWCKWFKPCYFDFVQSKAEQVIAEYHDLEEKEGVNLNDG